MNSDFTDFADAKVMTQGTVEYGNNATDTTVVEVAATPMMDAMTKAEIDVQIATARRYPRDIMRARKEAMSMAIIDADTAAACFYNLPRAGGVKGPSVRLAEIMNYAFGNIRAGSRVIAIEREFVVAQGFHMDLEKNVGVTIEVRRRITDKNGKRFNEDMITVTANAACSIAYRNATFKNIPHVYTTQIYEVAKKVAIGDASTLSENRGKWVKYFAKMGVTEERLLNGLGKKSVSDLGIEDLENMAGLSTAIKSGDTTIDEAFPAVDNKPKTKGSDKAFDKPATKEPEKPKESETQPSFLDDGYKVES